MLIWILFQARIVRFKISTVDFLFVTKLETLTLASFWSRIYLSHVLELHVKEGRCLKVYTSFKCSSFNLLEDH